MVVALAKEMDLVVVNIGGTDIADKNKMLVLAMSSTPHFPLTFLDLNHIEPFFFLNGDWFLQFRMWSLKI